MYQTKKSFKNSGIIGNRNRTQVFCFLISRTIDKKGVGEERQPKNSVPFKFKNSKGKMYTLKMPLIFFFWQVGVCASIFLFLKQFLVHMVTFSRIYQLTIWIPLILDTCTWVYKIHQTFKFHSRTQTSVNLSYQPI